MKKSFLIIFFLISIIGFAKAQNQNIDYFIVKENLLKNEKLAIIATDSLDVPLEKINGVFNFYVNVY